MNEIDEAPRKVWRGTYDPFLRPCANLVQLGHAWTLSPEHYAEFPGVDPKDPSNFYLGYTLKSDCMNVPTPPLENRLGRAFIFTKVLRFIQNKVRVCSSDVVRSDPSLIASSYYRTQTPGGRTNKSLQTCTTVPESISSPPPIPLTIRFPSSPWKTSDACQGTSSTIWSAIAKPS